MEELLLKARKKKTAATQQAAAQEDAAGVVDEDVVAGAVGGVDQAAAAKEKPKKFCWNCQTPDHAVELKKCSACRRVRHTSFFFPENLLLHFLIRLLAH